MPIFPEGAITILVVGEPSASFAVENNNSVGISVPADGVPFICAFIAADS